MILSELKEKTLSGLEGLNISITGLSHDDKEFLKVLKKLSIDLVDIEDANLLIVGHEAAGSEKVKKAKDQKIKTISLEDFKKNFLFKYGEESLKDKVVLVDESILDYEAVFLLNPKKVYFSFDINKKKALEVDVVISNNVSQMRNELEHWLSHNDKYQIVSEKNSQSLIKKNKM